MESWGVVFLGIIALGSLVQSAFLIGLAVSARRLSRRVADLQERVDRDLRPALDHLSRVTRNLAEVADLAVLQARRVDDLLADTVEKIESTTEVVRKLVLRPLGPLADLAAFFKGLRRGLEVYQTLRGFDRRERPPRGGYTEDDEHLFI
ncbi:MAG TPA: hypothetical protein VFM88_11320 [Vicinamibacteria bacterium]|nr:hypothetical protein [Vicinamibacteria bacterium]